MYKRELFIFNSKKRFLSLNRCRFISFFVTSPIYYPNDEPHIGHFFTNSICDILSRWKRLQGHEVIFSTGTDDHGIKIQKAAENQKISSITLVDVKSRRFKNLFKLAGMSFTHYIQTSTESHKSVVRDVWQQLYSKQLIQKQLYKGWYSIVDECFIPNNKSESFQTNKPTTVEWCEEENYIFEITKFKPKIQKWIDSGVIYPPIYQNLVGEYLANTDIVSVSRPSDRVYWGIPVPNDPSQTIYVWFDALINYLTVSRSCNGYWPPNVQIIGKDIIRFHTVLWPAILLALDMSLPKQIIVHSHWLLNGQKMSKSIGNIINPHKEAETLGGYEQLKYFLMSENTVENDSVYDSNRAVERINSHLANTAGNLLSRICGVKINPQQRIGTDADIDVTFSGHEFSELMKRLANLRSTFENHMDKFAFHLAINDVFDVLKWTNRFFDSQKPWSESSHHKRDAVIYITAESLRMCGILLQCLVPDMADKMLTKLSVSKDKRSLSDVVFIKESHKNIRHLENTGRNFVLTNKCSKTL